jgi:hypothetical protein
MRKDIYIYILIVFIIVHRAFMLKFRVVYCCFTHINYCKHVQTYLGGPMTLLISHYLA